MVLQYQEPISQVLNFFHKGKNDLECWFLVLIRTKVTPLFGNYLPFQHQDKGSMLTGLALFTRWRSLLTGQRERHFRADTSLMLRWNVNIFLCVTSTIVFPPHSLKFLRTLLPA